MKIEQATTEMGAFYYVAEDEYIAGALRQGVAWESDVLRIIHQHLPAAGPCNVIDVGAHVGTHTVPYSRWVRGRGRVYAFEPQALMADLLCRNVEQNGCGASVEILRFAAGHLDGVEISMENVIRDGPNAGQPFTCEDERAFNYGGLQIGVGGQKTVMRTLDSFSFEHVALLKVDAEGSEPLVLWGARELIRRCRPLIVFELNHKHVTASMRSMVFIPEEVRHFSIEHYAAEVGYAGMKPISSDLFLLLPAESRMAEESCEA
jgi:FkbM family methyltransferase